MEYPPFEIRDSPRLTGENFNIWKDAKFDKTAQRSCYSKFKARYGSLRLECRISGIASPRLRRFVLLAVFRQICRAIRYIPDARIRSSDDKGWNPILHEERPLSIRQAPALGTEAQKLGFKLRLARLEAGFSQSDLAKHTGISRGHLNQIERGRKNPSPNLLRRIDQVLSRRPLRTTVRSLA